MSSWNPKILFCCLIISLTLVCQEASAGQLSLTAGDGTSHVGDPTSLIAGILTLDQDGNAVEIPVETLTDESQQAVNAWAGDNPHMVDVHTNFDTPPELLRNNNPRDFLQRQHRNESGMVAIEVVISEKGDVMFASVVRSSNELLDEAAIASVKEWRFSPAKVDGNAVRTKIRVPMRF
jgi:protein TonB